jgi:hypothetical protein
LKAILKSWTRLRPATARWWRISDRRKWGKGETGKGRKKGILNDNGALGNNDFFALSPFRLFSFLFSARALNFAIKES